jgi:hypothetical protein
MLKLYIKQNPIYDKSVTTVTELHYEGANPQTLHTVPGALPAGSSRRWPNYGSPIDATAYVSDIYKLKLEWSANRDDSGNVAADQLKPVKGASGSLTFERTGYDLLKAWLVDDVSASLNSVEVSIQDTECGWYNGYIIKTEDLTWCEDQVCTFNVTLKQQDELLDCMKKTLVADNWQGWFNKVPSGGKKHPRFSYCNEVRPNGTLVMEWYVLTSLVATFTLLFLAIVPIINSTIAAIIVIASIINFLGGNVPVPSLVSITDFFDGVATIYIESSGCGREHPAPLIRDYISNVCDKCKIIVNADSAPIFFKEKQFKIDPSGRPSMQVDNPHYNACYLSAPVSSGLRRFRRSSILSGFQDPNNEYWIPDNEPLLYLDLFLDNIKGIYNADWRLAGGVLYIQRKDWYQDADPVYDFGVKGADRSKIIEGICYTTNHNTYPALVNGIYASDATDTCGNAAGNKNGTGQMNGALDFGSADDNPNLHGVMDKTQQLGATKFRFDGASGDYIYDAFQVIMNGGAFSFTQLPGLVYTVLKEVAKRLGVYGDHALLLSDETTTLPKILIWDGQGYENARAIKTKAAWDGVSQYPMPDINPEYNAPVPLLPQTWKQRHYPKTDVIGKGLTFSASPNGIYRVTDILGLVIAEQPALLVNYPMYFEPWYLDTLWDWFHWIDDPRKNPKLNKDWRVKIRYCCDEVDKLGLSNDAAAIKLLQKVNLPLGYHQEGRLKEIELSFDPSDEYGQYIELRGDV